MNTSLAGSVGIHYRTGYCASKFAATGFYESLRMEVSDDIDITILVTPSVDSDLNTKALVRERNKS